MTAFGLLATLLLAAILMACAAFLGAHPLWPYGLVAGLLLLPGLVWRMWGELEISVWNKGVRVTAGVLRAYALKVSYFTLFWPLSATGSSLRIAFRDGEASRWIAREGDNPRGQQWLIWLPPILWLLAVFRDEYQENAPPSSTYTLY